MYLYSTNPTFLNLIQLLPVRSCVVDPVASGRSGRGGVGGSRENRRYDTMVGSPAPIAGACGGQAGRFDGRPHRAVSPPVIPRDPACDGAQSHPVAVL